MYSEQLTEEDRKALAAKGYRNPRWFCRFFLSHLFTKPMPWVHVGVLAILTRRCEFLLDFDEEYTPRHLEKILSHFKWRENPEDPTSPEHPIFYYDGTNITMVLGQHTLIMMPRGMAKTTLANAANIWYIEYRDCKFPVYVSETQTHASRQMTNVTTELTTNRKLLAVFGSPKPEQRSGLTWSESEGLIQTTTGIAIAAKGRGSQVRGLNVLGERPDRFTVDDLEDKESVKTQEQRDKVKDFFFGDVMPAMPKLNKLASMTALGTLLANNALLTVLERDPSWTVIRFGAIDNDGEPLWEEWMSLEDIEKEKRSYAAKGLLHIFYLEYFNTIRDPDKAVFKPEYITVLPVALATVPFRAMAIDPAISKKKKACPSVIMVVGMTDNGKIQVLDGWGKVGATPREQIDKYFEMHFKWELTSHQHKHGVESIAYQASLIHFLQEEMFRQGRIHGPKAYFEITAQTHSEKKEERIQGILQPRYASGYMQHQRDFPELNTTLLDWPNGGFDWADVLAMAVALLDDVASLAAGQGVHEKDEYPPLEEVMGGDWRSN